MNLPLNIDIQQIFLHLFNFVILTGGLYILLYKPVKDFMEKRTAYYENLDKEANEKLKEAEKLKEDYQNQLKNMESEIAEAKSKATRETQKQCDAELYAAKKQAAKLVTGAQLEAEKERARILADAQKDIAELATTATKKMLYRSVSEAYDQFLAGVERGGANE